MANFDMVPRLQILHNSDKLLYYILFLRITPVVPNWFVNVSCPIVGVPLLQFVVGTFFGTTSSSVTYCTACLLRRSLSRFQG